MAKLTNIRRPATGYAIGGVDILIGIPTKENGKNTLVVTAGATAKDLSTVALATGITSLPSLIEFAEGGDNVCSYSDNTAFGANTYLTPVIGFKLDEDDDNSVAVAVEAFTFEKHSFLIKTKTGKYKVIGASNGLRATQANDGGDGTPAGFAGHDLVLTGGEVVKSRLITQASFEAILALVPTT